jgi:hypothetical protein
MRSRLAGIVLFACLISPAFGADTPPSDASLHELMAVMHVHNTLDGTLQQVDGMMHTSMESAMAGNTLDDGQRKIIASGQAKMRELLLGELTWEKMEPMYLNIYRQSFSQKEIDDMLAFYKSPSGQAVIAKLPVVTQQTLKSVQAEMNTLAPAMQQISRETANELRAYNAAKTKPASPP